MLARNLEKTCSNTVALQMIKAYVNVKKNFRSKHKVPCFSIN